MIKIHDLLTSNVGRAKNKRLFIVSECIAKDFPELLENYIDENDYVVSVCPEEHHINMIGYKIISFISYSNIREVTVLTVDGSLHCIQLQYIMENIRKRFFQDLKVRYLVLAKHNVVEIDERTITLSRYLSRLQKILSSKSV